MIICGIQISHKPSLCVIKNGKIIYYNEERKITQNKKIESVPFECINQIRSLHIDKFVVTGYNFNQELVNIIIRYINYLKINYKDLQSFYYPHHISHLFKSYVDSGFKNGRVFVIDGRGSNWYFNDYSHGYETCSVYNFSNNFIKCIYKNIFTKFKGHKKVNVNYNPDVNYDLKVINPYFIDESTEFNIDNKFDIGNLYSYMSSLWGYHNEEGKFMGLTAYGEYENKYYQSLLTNNFDTFSKNNNSAATVQKYFEDKYLNLVKKYEHENMIFTGGTALNVVNNDKIRKHFKNSNLYFEPLCGDEGNSIGAAYFMTFLEGGDCKKNDTLYLGTKINCEINKLSNNEIIEDNVEIEKILKLLSLGHVVGLIQGRAEAGPRALGNRSLLLDPTLKKCKDLMNQIKKREKFRPFACSVTEEDANNFFDLNVESPHMMFAPQATNKAKLIIPDLIHNDGTCRVQTVNKKQNNILYLLLKNFKIPVLMNTSFNLAGYPMVETFDDILNTLRNSCLKYVYFADQKKLLISNK